MDNTSDCRLYSKLLSSTTIYDVPILFISVLLCLAAVAVVCKQRLHKTLVYRLAMYQVVSSNISLVPMQTHEIILYMTS